MSKYLELESEYSKLVGTSHAVTTNTGTAALHLALRAAGVGPGDEVLVPEYTMVATAWAVTYTGATPVFVDCTDDLLMDMEDLEKKLTPKTKAIMPTHIYGRVCDMDYIMAVAEKLDLRVIEDACEAQGAMWGSQPVGSFDIGCFSFYWNKIIPAQEGGIVTTNDDVVAGRAKNLKNMAFGDNHDYLHTEIGFNYRMSDDQAGRALRSLRGLGAALSWRREQERLYDVFIPKEFKMPGREVVWVYDLKHPKKDELVQHLNDMGYAARHGFKPMSQQPMYDLPYKHLNSYRLSKEVFYLPINLSLTKDDIYRIAYEVKNFGL